MVNKFAVSLAAALAFVAIATGLRLFVGQFVPDIVPFAAFFPAVIASALLWGWVAGFLSVGFATLSAWYFVMPPQGSWDLSNPSAAANLILFVIAGSFVVVSCALFREQRSRLISERNRSDALVSALRQKSAELETVLETVPAAVWFTFDRDVSHVTRNRLAADLLRMPQTGLGSFSPKNPNRLRHVEVFREGQPVAPDDMPLQRAMRGLPTMDEELTYRFAEGDEIILLSQGRSLVGDGQIIGAVAVGLDITARKQAEQHRALLVNELNHRVKNMLATVQAMAQLSFRSGGEARALEAFTLRLQAFAAIHDMLTRQHWADVALADLVTGVLKPVCGPPGRRYTLSGPDVVLPSQQAVSMSMVLHELCTNAIKYGALSNATGHVTVTWTRSAAGAIDIEWLERGGPTVARPDGAGFGSRLLRGLARGLGSIEIDYPPDGVVCRIRIVGDEAPAAAAPALSA